MKQFETKKVSLDEWHNEMIDGLKEFVDFWRVKSQIDPDNYPRDILKGEWDEQFIFFCEGEKCKRKIKKGNQNE